MCMCVSVSMQVHVDRIQKQVLGPLKLDSQKVVSS